MGMFEELKNSTIDNLKKVIGQSEDREYIGDQSAPMRSGIYDEFNNYLNAPGNRIKAYNQYEEMAHGSIPSKVLKILSDDAFGIKTGGQDLIWVTAESDEVQQEATEFIKDKQIPSRLRTSAENLLKYGDEFLYLYPEEGEGIERVEWDLHPSIFRRYEKDAELFGFSIDKGQERREYTNSSKGEAVNPWRVIHIRSGLQDLRKRFFEEGKVHEGQYGKSAFADALMDWKKLNLMEDSMVLSRYSKSRRPLFIYIDVSGYNKKKKKELFEKRKRQILQSVEMSGSGDEFDVGRDIQGKSKPIFVAVDEQGGQIEYDDMSEDTNVESIVDVEYLRDKVYGAFEVPGAFLGLEDKLPGSVGSENALMPISIQYARTVRRYQGEVLSALKRMLRIHFAYKGNLVGSDEIEVHTQSVTTAEDLTRAETAGQLASTFQNLTQLFDRGPLGDVDIDQNEMASYILDELNMPGLKSEDIIGENAEDVPEEKLESVNSYLGPNTASNSMTAYDNNQVGSGSLSEAKEDKLKEAIKESAERQQKELEEKELEEEEE